MAFRSSILLLLSILCITSSAQPRLSGEVSPGSSLSTSFKPDSWLSPSGRFAFGFYQQDNGFAIGIWLVGKLENIVVWTANRDDPVLPANSSVILTQDGKFVIRTEGLEKQIGTDKFSASYASMLDTGNFVLYSKDGHVIWETFRNPTDTILGGQHLLSGDRLVSSSSETKHSTGRFLLVMQGDGNLVLYPLNSPYAPDDAYWSTQTWKEKGLFLRLSITGCLQLINATDSNIIQSITGCSMMANNTIYRATLETNGVFRLYSHWYNGSNEPKQKIEWETPKDYCQINGYCGFNSFCTYNDNLPYCKCLPSFEYIDPNQPLLGCERNYSLVGCQNGKGNEKLFSITPMEFLTWRGPYYNETKMSQEDCSNSCIEDCNCGAALLSYGFCKKQNLPLKYVRRISSSTQTFTSTSTSTSTVALLKVGTRNIEGSQTSLNPPILRPPIVVRSHKETVKILLMIFGFLMFSCGALIISGVNMYKLRFLRYSRLLKTGEDGLTLDFTLRLFSYNELKRATKNFTEELGKGSFGTVYKGSLCKGKEIVAVKRLEKLVEEGEKEFRAEMRSIGKTHHRNLVRLLGYCATDSKRLLVYEYMRNGSLADLLFKSNTRPNWDERIRIALDVARGILYLHEECEAPIIHCDIKPQNILMDDFWNAKISDFGLAKLLMPDQTRTFTIVRGTRGYLAPEWHKNVPISVKADVYSFGIVLLEIVCCRKNMEIQAANPEEIVLSTWAYKCFTTQELDRLVVGEQVENKGLEKMVAVALWCIQDEPVLRPSMKSVVLMMEGVTDVSVPPCPIAKTTM
ncbi:hypothetical protein K2173_005156 [Erythroxylum novogranatense]|uniref:Receptor-like serine/threonine-protein kinase n=1 Tax=Erythroxylum novogranatense TaxID=1862640 RepID=A0AAV8TTP2_9ROSI|nr:hypothetical protein K2173_005156 [Erythroxylum novogranatense]